ATPYIYNQGMLSSLNTGRVQGILIRGIDQKQINDVYPLAEHLTKGNLKNLKSGEFGIILGKGIANYFGVSVGDKVSLITPEASVTPAGFLPRIKRFTVVGIFKIGDLYDDKQAFIDIKDADKLFRMHGAVNGIQLKVADELEAPRIAREVRRDLNEDYSVMDWTQEFGNFFKALQIQKTVMTFILLLIIAVAAFNLVSSLVMMVSDKRSDIAILRTLGASKRSIMGIFIAQGSIIGLVGTALGVIFGLFLALNVTGWVDKIQETFNVELVAKDVYLVGFLPSEIHQIDIVYIVILALIMCFIATLYPAWRAASIQPAEALRYE
ncbi:MAG TPA: lipoprotein-releasing ABC transporter permease subunit, partial [Gammaproteobacteria bacterium]|nr:lipoprotein-releasing ABC transporter permease subunit [Gammaproteobacteria bacterium]